MYMYYPHYGLTTNRLNLVSPAHLNTLFQELEFQLDTTTNAITIKILYKNDQEKTEKALGKAIINDFSTLDVNTYLISDRRLIAYLLNKLTEQDQILKYNNLSQLRTFCNVVNIEPYEDSTMPTWFEIRPSEFFKTTRIFSIDESQSFDCVEYSVLNETHELRVSGKNSKSSLVQDPQFSSLTPLQLADPSRYTLEARSADPSSLLPHLAELSAINDSVGELIHRMFARYKLNDYHYQSLQRDAIKRRRDELTSAPHTQARIHHAYSQDQTDEKRVEQKSSYDLDANSVSNQAASAIFDSMNNPSMW